MSSDTRSEERERLHSAGQPLEEPAAGRIRERGLLVIIATERPLLLIVLIAVLVGVMAIIAPDTFLRPANAAVVLLDTAQTGILACGMMLLMIAGMFGMVGLSLLSLVLSMFGIDTGLFGTGGLGLVTAIIGLTLGVFMLILDFDFVENGIAAGLPERESWRAAFALTVSLVWIYTNLLRILAILRGD